MIKFFSHTLSSFRRTLVFWWILFFLVQQVERLFLLPEAWSAEEPTPGILAKTFLAGLRADLIVATLGILLAVVVARVMWLFPHLIARWRRSISSGLSYQRYFKGVALCLGIFLLLFLTIDMGYYGYHRTHLDMVFFEFVDDLLSPRLHHEETIVEAEGTSQAFKQTQAEVQDVKKWGLRVGAFLGAQGIIIVVWCLLFRGFLVTGLVQWSELYPRASRYMLAVALMGGVVGFSPYGPLVMQRAGISSAVYYTLAQNPIWYAGEVGVGNLLFRMTGGKSELLQFMPFEEALELTRETLDLGDTFHDPDFPLVRQLSQSPVRHEYDPINILIIFVEALDRRYLGRNVSLGESSHLRSGLKGVKPFIYATPQYAENQPSSMLGGQDKQVRLTPFFDQLKKESVFFENFFTNGDKTASGLFSTLCSYFPRRGWAVMKTRYAHEFLCLPSVLKHAGYRTEMVVGQNRDRNYDHIGLFMARNGLQQLLDENDYPEEAERLGIGMTDNSLLDFLGDRLAVLQRAEQPFFLMTLTTGTHHPYPVPQKHPDVMALQVHEDPYVPALRNVDIQFERFFHNLDGTDLLNNTIVFILGDHGRHEGIGWSDASSRAGHFLSPLFVWIDPSLRDRLPFKPHVVSAITSQVDIVPTILSLVGLTPQWGSFLGKDLNCLLQGICTVKSVAFLSGNHDDTIGIVDQQGMLLYSFHRNILFEATPHGRTFADDRLIEVDGLAVNDENSQLSQRFRRMLALYVTSNLALEQNRIWPSQGIKEKL